MKKLATLAIMLIAASSASAQLYIGGSFGLNRDMSENQTEFSILPEIGCNLNKTWAVGAAFGYQHMYNDGISSNIGVINPYARYTWFRTDNKLISLFVDGGVDMSFGATKYRKISSDTLFAFGIGFKPGISINPTDKFSIVAHIGELGYWGANDAGKAAGLTSHWGLNFSTLNLNIGFYYNF